MVKKIIWIVIWAAAVSATVDGSSANDTIKVEHDHDSFVSTVTIQSSQGRIAWRDILRGLARAKGFDDDALDGILPNASFDLTSVAARLQITLYSVVFSPDIQFDVDYPDDDLTSPNLRIRMNRESLLKSKRRMNAWLRDKSLSFLSRNGKEPHPRDFHLRLDKGWRKSSRKRPIVVAVHGLNSDSCATEPLLVQPREAGFACGHFDYPNDQPIDESAKLLSAELKKLAAQDPDRSVALVTHSMGGLVARSVIETAALDPGNVQQLIMIAPPNQGSMLAHFAFGLDLHEFITDAKRRRQSGKLYAMIEDGFSEAAVDLRPNSVFLRRLNRRERNKKVDYTIILGTQATLAENDLDNLRRVLTRGESRSRWIRFFGPKLDPMLADLFEVVDGQGDGAVAVKRGKLEGVDDVVLLPFGHTDVFATMPPPEIEKIHTEIAKRLNFAADER